MKKLTFEKIMQLWLILAAIFGLIIIIFTVISISDEISAAKHSYIITQNNVTYTGNIIRGDDYVKVIDRDDNMIILDAAHGPISIRRSDLGNFSID
jgi:hypothetical protein